MDHLKIAREREYLKIPRVVALALALQTGVSACDSSEVARPETASRGVPATPRETTQSHVQPDALAPKGKLTPANLSELDCPSTSPVTICGQALIGPTSAPHPTSHPCGFQTEANEFSVAACAVSATALELSQRSGQVTLPSIAAGNVGVAVRSNLDLGGKYKLELPKAFPAVLVCLEALDQRLLGPVSGLPPRCRIVLPGDDPVRVSTLITLAPFSMAWESTSPALELQPEQPSTPQR